MGRGSGIQEGSGGSADLIERRGRHPADRLHPGVSCHEFAEPCMTTAIPRNRKRDVGGHERNSCHEERHAGFLGVGTAIHDIRSRGARGFEIISSPAVDGAIQMKHRRSWHQFRDSLGSGGGKNDMPCGEPRRAGVSFQSWVVQYIIEQKGYPRRPVLPDPRCGGRQMPRQGIK